MNKPQRMVLTGGQRWARLGLTLLVVMALPTTMTAHAAKKEDSAAAQALRKAQGMLRELSQQKQALDAENASLREQVQKLEGQAKLVDPLQGEVARQRSALDELRNTNGSLESHLKGERERYHALMLRQKEIVEQAKKIQADNQLLVRAVQEREDWIARCGEKNQGMLEANRELVERYKDKGFWDKLGEIEPLTGIGKVSTENVEQEYRFKLRDLQMTPFQAQTGLAATTSPTNAPDAEGDDEDD